VFADWRDIANLPKDPSTGSPYEYYVINPHSFSLCSNFYTKSPAASTSQEGYVYGRGWEHYSDRSCYERDVDSLPAELSPPS